MLRLRSSHLLVALCFALWLVNASVSLGQQHRPAGRASKPSSADGRSTFNSSCAGCHGLDGRGSDKAVDISSSTRVQHLSDAELSAIIQNGVPGTGMPGFHTLSQRQNHAVIEYLRSLQGRGGTRTFPGDAERGREIFYGKGECSNCHAVSGHGGFLGPDLSAYASTTSAKAIREEILKPQRTPMHGYRSAVLVTKSGERIEGLVRNEDNFSIQLQTSDGNYHFFSKSDLRSFDHVEGSLMPTNYGERLSEKEMNDLVSFLMKSSPEGLRPPPRKTEDAE